MAQTLESKVERTACAKAKKLGWLNFKFESSSCNGVPDRLLIRGGRVVFIEFKAPGKKAEPLQLAIHNIMRQHGAEVHVCDNVEDALEILK